MCLAVQLMQEVIVSTRPRSWRPSWQSFLFPTKFFLLGRFFNYGIMDIYIYYTYIFNLLGKLAGKHEYVCNVHLSKMSPFWLKWDSFSRDLLTYMYIYILLLYSLLISWYTVCFPSMIRIRGRFRRFLGPGAEVPSIALCRPPPRVEAQMRRWWLTVMVKVIGS